MRKQIYLLLGIAVCTVLVSCASAPETATVQEAQSGFTFTEGSVQETRDFLRLHGYYIATVDGDQPQVRPFGTAAIFEGEALHHNEQSEKRLTANGGKSPYRHCRP